MGETSVQDKKYLKNKTILYLNFENDKQFKFKPKALIKFLISYGKSLRPSEKLLAKVVINLKSEKRKFLVIWGFTHIKN